MLVIGLTGGIGSGKSTVADLFAAHDIAIIDTDKIAHQLVEPDQPALIEIIKRFGTSILTPTSVLDRKKMRAIIFSDMQQRLWLEQLLHPLIRAEVEHQVQQVTSPYCIVVIPLLVETHFNPVLNRVLVVDAPREHQIARTFARDQMSMEQIEAILATQASREKRLAAADDVIRNESSVAELVSQVEKLHQKYLKLSKSAK